MVTEFIEPGAYDLVINNAIARRLASLSEEQVLIDSVEPSEFAVLFSRYISKLAQQVLVSLPPNSDTRARIKVVNSIIDALAAIQFGGISTDDQVVGSDKPLLWAIKSTEEPFLEIEVPSTRLSSSALLVNGRNQPRLGHELGKELTTTDQLDLIISFVMNSGVNFIEERLRDLIARGGSARIITTTYIGATERVAVDRLARLGAHVKISYDSSTTRLHAKTWLLKRNTGSTTAYVGSSNLSGPALSTGIEWNLRISAQEQPHIISAIGATFEDYWNDPEFETYNPDIDAPRLDEALRRANTKESRQLSISFIDIEVTPRPFQQEVLDQLEFQRVQLGRTRNLVVMATGTGKTVVAGLDFKRMYKSGQVNSLLFVAHRKEILQQSLVTFRTILRDGSFGELYVDGEHPMQWTHVFASIQSLTQRTLDEFPKNKFDMIIIDEFHHAAADSYERLLNHFKPGLLVGLTATPERSDGRPILQWFDNSISAELRLWEAIDRQILCPFHYFGLHDNIDLEARGVTWTRGRGYDVEELSNVYTGNDARVALILEQLQRYVANLDQVKGIGFCVSIDHANFMASRFTQAGLTSRAVTSQDTSLDRQRALNELRNGSVKFIFAVDIFNEGVDIPDVNTILMLRPTESSTVFLQQLGRGLRRAEGKGVLTVLDFVGNQSKEFRFDKKYGALFGKGRRRLQREIDDDFPYLPSGCNFVLDKITKEIVLENIRLSLKVNKAYIATELRNIGNVGITDFLDLSGLTLSDFYRSGRSLLALQHEIFGGPEPSVLDQEIAKAIPRILHIDDTDRIAGYSEVLEGKRFAPTDKYALMLAHLIFQSGVDMTDAEDRLEEVRSSLIVDEMRSVLGLLNRSVSRITKTSSISPDVLRIHGSYSRAEIFPAFGISLTGAEVSGVRFAKSAKADLAFVTLNKTEEHFSPETMYADTALSSTIFQWESQSSTSSESPTGQRYIKHREVGTSFHLFVREWKNDPESGLTMPFMYFGPADYQSHEGSRPMRIRWKLQFPLPADVLVRSKVLAS